MAETFDLILKGGTVVNQDGEGRARYRHPQRSLRAPSAICRVSSAGEVVDCRGLHLLPGVIDTHVHFREPGLTHKEDLETGSRGAVLGGVTAVFEMPNTIPLTTDAAALADKVKRAHSPHALRLCLLIGATRENTHELGELERLPGAAGVKVFMGSSTGSLLIEDDDGAARRARKRSTAAPHSIPKMRTVCASA